MLICVDSVLSYSYPIRHSLDRSHSFAYYVRYSSDQFGLINFRLAKALMEFRFYLKHKSK